MFAVLFGSLGAETQLWLFFVWNKFLIPSVQSGATGRLSVPARSLGKLPSSFIFQSLLPLWGISEASDATADCAVSQLSRRLCLHKGVRAGKSTSHRHTKAKMNDRKAKYKGRVFFSPHLDKLDHLTFFFNSRIKKGCLTCLGWLASLDFIIARLTWPFSGFIFTSGPPAYTVRLFSFFFLSLSPSFLVRWRTGPSVTRSPPLRSVVWRCRKTTAPFLLSVAVY